MPRCFHSYEGQQNYDHSSEHFESQHISHISRHISAAEHLYGTVT